MSAVEGEAGPVLTVEEQLKEMSAALAALQKPMAALTSRWLREVAAQVLMLCAGEAIFDPVKAHCWRDSRDPRATQFAALMETPRVRFTTQVSSVSHNSARHRSNVVSCRISPEVPYRWTYVVNTHRTYNKDKSLNSGISRIRAMYLIHHPRQSNMTAAYAADDNEIGAAAATANV